MLNSRKEKKMKQTVRDLELNGKKVLIRVDFNVPIKNGKILSDKKIVDSIPTIKFVLDAGASVILCSHLGRPQGRDKSLSLKIVFKRLGKYLKRKMFFADDVVSKDAKTKAKNLRPGEVLLLENVRFEKGETKNDEAFAKKLAGLADVFVNDAFGTCHREHASTVGVTKFLPSAIGLLVEKEIEKLSEVITNPERPYVAILGGSKVTDKIGIISNLMNKVDTILIGGAMAFTFISAVGGSVGSSKVDFDNVEIANKLLAEAKSKGVNVVLPVDAVCAPALAENVKTKTFNSFEIPEGMIGLDVGEKTLRLYAKALKNAKTVVWNGPVGAFEFKKFSKGTKKLAKIVGKIKANKIAGGGDTANAIISFGLTNKFTHLSTGGGASLKFFEGKALPGIEIIPNVAKQKKVK